MRGFSAPINQRANGMCPTHADGWTSRAGYSSSSLLAVPGDSKSTRCSSATSIDLVRANPKRPEEKNPSWKTLDIDPTNSAKCRFAYEVSIISALMKGYRKRKSR
jgi:hypothetical protein